MVAGGEPAKCNVQSAERSVGQSITVSVPCDQALALATTRWTGRAGRATGGADGTVAIVSEKARMVPVVVIASTGIADHTAERDTSRQRRDGPQSDAQHGPQNDT